MKLVINIPDEQVLAAFTEACKPFLLKPKANIMQNRAFGVAIEEDLKTFFCDQLTEWFEEGINNDCYADFVDDEQVEDEDE